MNELVISHDGRQARLAPGESAVVGRATASLLRVGDPRVSREHVRLNWSPDGWVLDSVGRSGTYVQGRPVTRVVLTGPVEARLAAADGPLVRFDPVGVPLAPGPAPAGGPAPDAAPVAVPAPAGPVTAAGPGAGFFGAQAGGVPGPAPGGARAAPPGPVPPRAGAAAPGPGMAPGPSGSPLAPPPETVAGALRMLLPISAWLKDPAMRRWYRLVVAVYALAPVVLLVLLQHTTSLQTLGWVYCLYVAPLWALVFWFLIQPPGPFSRLEAVVAGAFLLSQVVLIPVLTVPWEGALAPPKGSSNLFGWILGVGLAEEFTKALPVLVVSLVLLRVRKIKLDVRMWMFLATLSGLMFGVYEASTVYVPIDVAQIARGSAFGIPEFAERVFVDGLQHAIWAGIAGFFIGLGVNYRRQRIALWVIGLALPSVLHGLNDWSLSGVFGQTMWPWILIQAFSLLVFLGYTTSAASIETRVRHTPIFRGDSLLMDMSGLADQSGQQPRPGAGRGPG